MARSLIAVLTILALAVPAAAQIHAPPPRQQRAPAPVQLQQELSRLLTEVAALEGRVQNLRGDYRTIQDVNRRLSNLRNGLTRLIQVAPQVVQPVVIVTTPAAPPPAPAQPVIRAMTSREYASVLASIRAESFDDGKLTVLRTVAKGSRYFSVAHVREIIELLSFSEGKLEVVRILKPRIADPDNAFQLYDSFRFDSDKETLRGILDAP